MLTAVLLAIVAVVAVFAYRELVNVRRQVSGIRQSLEWFGVGYLENRDLSPRMRDYIQKTKEDLIQEGLHEGTITEELADEVRKRAD
jgi:hypothetical protein